MVPGGGRAGITFGVAFSEDKEGTYLGAFDTTTGQIYHIRDFPYNGPNPTYGNSVYDFKNQVRRKSPAVARVE